MGSHKKSKSVHYVYEITTICHSIFKTNLHSAWNLNLPTIPEVVWSIICQEKRIIKIKYYELNDWKSFSAS